MQSRPRLYSKYGSSAVRGNAKQGEAKQGKAQKEFQTSLAILLLPCVIYRVVSRRRLGKLCPLLPFFLSFHRAQSLFFDTIGTSKANSHSCTAFRLAANFHSVLIPSRSRRTKAPDWPGLSSDKPAGEPKPAARPSHDCIISTRPFHSGPVDLLVIKFLLHAASCSPRSY